MCWDAAGAGLAGGAAAGAFGGGDAAGGGGGGGASSTPQASRPSFAPCASCRG